MKLRNKETGEIWDIRKVLLNDYPSYDSLEHINEDFEDYEEPKEIYFISNNGQIHEEDGHDRYREARKEIGNYFETEEEAKKAVKKLKAWKRLKDKGFRFNCWYGGSKDMSFSIPQEIIDRTTAKDLDLLFGGEE